MFELENALDEYMSYLRIEQGSSPRTAEAYRRDLEEYLAFLDKRGVDAPGDVKRDDVVDFEHHLAEAGLATTTVRRRISAVRGYHRFLVREGLTSENPAEAVDIPKAADRLPDVLSIGLGGGSVVRVSESADGTVSANKVAARIVSDAAGKFVQEYSWFDSKKSGGLTISYMRFGDAPVHEPWLIITWPATRTST